MNLGRPEQTESTTMPSPSTPALENVVRSHSAQLSKLNTELSSAFSQVTGEMGELKTSSVSTSSTLFTLANQVAALTDMVARLLHAPAAESPPTLPPVCLAAPSPAVPQGEPLDPRWEPSLTPPRMYSGEFDKCRGFLGQCQLMFLHQPSRFRSDGAKVALIISSLSDRALDWAMATVGSNPQLATDLRLFSDEFENIRSSFKRVAAQPFSGVPECSGVHSGVPHPGGRQQVGRCRAAQRISEGAI